MIHVSTASAASFTLIDAGIRSLSPLYLGGSLALFCGGKYTRSEVTSTVRAVRQTFIIVQSNR